MTTSSKHTNILLLGAGELGLALLPNISSAIPHSRITIGVRSPAKYTHLRSCSTSLAKVDLESPSSALVETFSRFEIVISATGFASSPSSVTKLANEVLQAGRLRKSRGQGRLWFFPWQWGVDYDITLDGNGLMPLFGAQKEVRDLLRREAAESGVKWTIVSTGIFMSFLFAPFWGIVSRPPHSEEKDREGREDSQVTVRCLGDWSHGVTVTHVDDIGRVLSRILVGHVESENRVLYVAGDSVQYGELADVVERIAGCRVVRQKWGVEELREEVRRDPEDGIKKYRLVYAGEGVWWAKEKTVNWNLGMDMMDVEAYAKKLFGV